MKIHGEPAGIFYLNNTYVGEFRQLSPVSNMHLRNNLLLGQGVTPRVLSVETFTNYSDSDYNGFRVNPGAAESFGWSSPPLAELRNYYRARRDASAQPVSQTAASSTNAPGQGRTLVNQTAIPLEQRAFATLAAYSKATGQDRHSRLLDFDVFVNAPAPDFSDPTRVVDPQSIDLTLRARSKAVDAGIAIANITDGFKGKAPDLGAYELGAPLPHYGPRPR